MVGITLRHMEYLVAVIDEGSMTAAAARLHVTQATVSMALAECERRLGVPLLVLSLIHISEPTRPAA